MEIRDAQSFERLTGLAFFKPTGSVYRHLGNIELLKLDFGLQSVDILRSRRGIVYPRKRHYYGRTPVFSIQGNQFATPTRFIQLAGTRQTNLTQTATTGATLTVTAVAGAAYSLGKYGCTITSVTVGGIAKVQGYDYFVDGPEGSAYSYNGFLWLPQSGGSIVVGDSVIITYSYPAYSIEKYTALDTLSVDGALIVIAEDNYGAPANEVWDIASVTLSAKESPQTEPGKFRSYTYEAMIYGNPTVYKRAEREGFMELITDTDSIIDLS